MTEKMEGILMDEELDLVVGGAKTAVCIPDPDHEGKFIVMQSSESGDVDKMKKLLSGGCWSSDLYPILCRYSEFHAL